MLSFFLPVIFSDNVTLILTVKAFQNPGDYYNLDNIDAQGVRDIERFIETGSPNEYNIKVICFRESPSAVILSEPIYVHIVGHLGSKPHRKTFWADFCF